MKALSIKQPWITLILGGQKTIEVRSRNTSYRGDVLLCSSKTPDLTKEDMREFEQDFGITCLYGHALCVARLVDSRPLREGDEDAAYMEEIDPDLFGWVLEAVRPVVPFPLTGRLGFYEGDDRLIKASPFAIGDCVRIREDVELDSGSEFALRGGQGRVVFVEFAGDETLVSVMLDSPSLRAIPVSHLESCVADKAVWHTFLFEPEELQPAEPRDTLQETWNTIEEIERQHPELFPEEEGDAT